MMFGHNMAWPTYQPPWWTIWFLKICVLVLWVLTRCGTVSMCCCSKQQYFSGWPRDKPLSLIFKKKKVYMPPPPPTFSSVSTSPWCLEVSTSSLDLQTRYTIPLSIKNRLIYHLGDFIEWFCLVGPIYQVVSYINTIHKFFLWNRMKINLISKL